MWPLLFNSHSPTKQLNRSRLCMCIAYLDWTYSDQRFFIFSFFFGSCGRLSCLICQLSSARIYSIFTSDVFLDRDQGLGLDAPRGQKWKFWSWIMKSWTWSWTFGLGLGLEEKVLQFFKTFVVFLDGSDQCTPWHFLRDNKSSLPFGRHCLGEHSALHAHQPQLRGYLTMGLFVRPHRRQ